MRVLGDFVIDTDARLGAGGSGTVYKGYQKALNNRPVAIKILHKNIAGTHSEEDLERFKREIQALAKLNDPRIVHIYSAGKDEDTGDLWYAMELIEGKTLDRIISEHELNQTEIIDTVIEIAKALISAYSVGIIHRDIKPTNIFITANKDVKLADFGLARLPGTCSLTQSDTIIGTLDYISPERIHGKDEDVRSDIYSYGAVVYEMIAKSPPFGNNISTPEILYKHLNNKPPRVRVAYPSIHPKFEQIIMKMLAKDPESRPQNYEEIIAKLTKIKEELLSSPLPATDNKLLLSATVIIFALIAITMVTAKFITRTPSQSQNKLNPINPITENNNTAAKVPPLIDFSIADTLYENEEYQEAAELYHTYLSKWRDNSYLQMKLFYCLLLLNRFDGILQNLQLADYHYIAKILKTITKKPQSFQELTELRTLLLRLVYFQFTDPKINNYTTKIISINLREMHEIKTLLIYNTLKKASSENISYSELSYIRWNKAAFYYLLNYILSSSSMVKKAFNSQKYDEVVTYFRDISYAKVSASIVQKLTMFVPNIIIPEEWFIRKPKKSTEYDIEFTEKTITISSAEEIRLFKNIDKLKAADYTLTIDLQTPGSKCYFVLDNSTFVVVTTDDIHIKRSAGIKKLTKMTTN
ncbi:MAG: serine/threonine protein kinase, partial [Planctomycetes bacterium]|nr:serine/threonine protein kinase [Planctomycetota bacterium]